MLAYDYPLLGLFWSMLMLFLWFAWLMLLFRVFGDIFRSTDLGGFAKAFWSLFVIVLPFVGVLAYIVARGHSMAQRDLAQARRNEGAFRAYVQDVAADRGTADELAKLADLKARGVLTDEEFAQHKAKLLLA